MTILVFGGSGNVSRALVPMLQEAGARVRVATRSSARAQSLPGGVEPVIADMDDPPSLRAAFDGVSSVFLLVANGPNEVQQGLATLAIAQEFCPGHIVYLSSDLSTRAPMIPHAGAKVAIEAALKASAMAHTILRPTYFAQNDLLTKGAISSGVYPAPLGPHPVARVDVRDVATAAATALLQARAENEVFVLSSPDAPNGMETAALWSKALVREVAYPDLTPEAFADGAQSTLPPWLNFDLLIMHRWFRDHGHPIDEKALDRQRTLLPDGPRSYTDFVMETGEAWNRVGASNVSR
ncbi:MAG: NmrA family NAD(P)-binding protein [Pseudomonadota bacterium]